MNFHERLMRFLSGRYGADDLFFVLVVAAAVLSVCNLFFKNLILQTVVYALILFALFRFFSRNHEQRRKENACCRRLLHGWREWADLRQKQKNDLFHLYKRCPACKAVLRLPRRPGRHETVCPKCGNRFSVKVRGK